MQDSSKPIKKRPIKTILWVLGIILSIAYIGFLQDAPDFGAPIVFALLVILVIWSYPNEEVMGMKNRLLQYKFFKLRSIGSGLVLLTLLVSLPHIAAIVQQRSQLMPYVSIINIQESGGKIDVGTSAVLKLEIKVENGGELLVNSGAVSLESGTYVYTADISGSTGTMLRFIGSGKYDTITKDVIIVRTLTEREQNDINEKIAAENKAKEEEQKKVDEQKAAEEKAQKEYMESPEYKNKVIKEKLQEIISKEEFSMTRTCKDGIKLMLKSPSTADFPAFDYNFFTVDDKIIIKSYVDAQNSFGAQIRTYFSCYFQLTGDTVELVDLKLAE